MLEMEMKGRMKAIDIKGNWADGSSNKLTAMYFDENIMIIIMTKLSNKVMGTTDMTIFFPRFVPRATKVLIAIGNPSCVKAIKREYVGITKL